MSINILKEDIRNERIRNLYLFYGPEEFLIRHYVDSIESSILAKDLKMLNKVVMEGRIPLASIMEHCETLPIFSERKLVVVKNSGFFKPGKKDGGGKPKTKAKSKDKSGIDDFSTSMENLPSHVCLVFCEAEIDKRVKVVEAVKKHGLVVEFALQKPVDLVKWAMKVAKSSGKLMDQVAASYLVDNSEQRMNELLNEINKVVLYVDDRSKVTLQDVEKVCTKSVKSRIFDLTDAIAERNTAKAILLFNDMLILKEPIPRIIFMITRHFRQILEMKLLISGGMSMSGAASQIGVTPYAAGKISRQASSLSEQKLKQALEACLQADVAIKTGRMDEKIAAELLIAEISA